MLRRFVGTFITMLLVGCLVFGVKFCTVNGFIVTIIMSVMFILVTEGDESDICSSNLKSKNNSHNPKDSCARVEKENKPVETPQEKELLRQGNHAPCLTSPCDVSQNLNKTTLEEQR